MKFYTHTLSNGLTLIGEQSDTAVASAIGFFVRTGARDEEKPVAGVSHFLEHMLFKGTERRSALDISYELGAIGAQANAFTSEENTVYYMALLPEYLPRGLDLLSDMMRSVLDQSEFDVEKKVILEEIALYQDRPTFMLFEAATQAFFGAHAAGNSVLGTIESITALSREQMKQYFDSRYVPSNMVFAIAGSFDWDFVVEEMEKHCGSWQGARAERLTPAHIPSPYQATLSKADIHRAHICLVAPGPAAQSEDRFAANVLACMLGDHSGSKVYWELIDKGLADSASIDVEEMDACGMVYAYASCSPERIDQVEDILRSILASAADFETEMYQRALTKLATRLVLQGESAMRRLMSIGLDWNYRGSYLSLEEELLRLKQVSEAELRGLIGRFPLQPSCALRLMPA